jgi:hypothetical protein
LNRHAKRLLSHWNTTIRRNLLVRLIGHFFGRFFEVGSAIRDPYARLEISPLLGLAAAPGAVMSFILLLKYSPLARWFTRNFDFDYRLAAIPDKYIFIVFSMTATGIIAVIKWERLFPDRRDFANLAPLPLSMRIVFVAKLFALIMFALIFAIALNAASAILFPFISMENNGTLSDILRFLFAHAGSVIMASTFVFCFFVALAGLLMNLLPYAIFRRTTRYVQFTVIASLLVMFFLAPMTAQALLPIRDGGQSPYAWLPPVWFVGLSETWHGRATPSFESLGALALRSFAGVVVIAVAAYAAAYKRYFLLTAETPEIAGGAGRIPPRVWRIFDSSVLRSPFERGCFRFTVKTLMRSERHNSVLAAFMALGSALAIQASLLPAPDPGDLGINPFGMSTLLTILFFLITGLRCCFGITYEEQSNWTFQSNVAARKVNPRGIVRKFMWIAVGFVIVSSVPLYAALSSLSFASLHAAFSAVQSVLLIELLLLDFYAIPFTCISVPGRENFVFAAAIFFVAYLLFAHASAILEYWLILHPPMVAVYLVIVTGVLSALRWLQEPDRSIEFEQPAGQLQLLRLFE